LLKENTPCYHKIRQECGFTQKAHFSLYYCVLFPTVHTCKNTPEIGPLTFVVEVGDDVA